MRDMDAEALVITIEPYLAGINDLCEIMDDGLIKLMDEKHEDESIVRAVLTHLKDARAALERAKGAIP